MAAAMSGPRSPTLEALRHGERPTSGERDAEPARAERPRMILRTWRPLRKGSLVGFAAISLPNGLEVDDVAILMTHGRAWAALPGRPVIADDGRVAKIPGTSKARYISILRGRDRALSTAFSERVVELVRAQHPGALDCDGGAS
jgi:hypothetical protein